MLLTVFSFILTFCLGGGPPKTKKTKEDPMLERVLSLVGPAVNGMNNQYDSDAIVIATHHVQDDNEGKKLLIF